MSKKLSKNTPELRFPEFRDSWNEKRLEQLFSEFKSGYGITAEEISKHGTYPVFGGNGLRGYTESFTHDGFYFLIGRQGALCGNINLTYGRAYISEHAIACRANDTSDTEWLAQRLDYYNLNKLSESSAQPGLSVNKLLRFKLFVPLIAEQEKIASFLGAVDARLTQLRHKQKLLQTYKRGVMQKIFSQQIRFKQDDGTLFPNWEKKKLGELATRQTKKNEDSSITRVLTNSATQGVVDQQDYFDKDIANADNLAGYYVINKGDYVYNPRISVNAPVGPINKNKIAQGVMSPLYTVFRFKSHNNQLYEQYFKTSFWHKYMCSVANYGARHDRMNIVVSDFLALPLPSPCQAEQQKIVDFLTSIDQKIEAVALQIETMEKFKKGLLQKMFV
jgi:type I restriction enzyme S subunit